MEFKDSRLGACGLGWLSFIRLRACGSGLLGGFKGLRVCGLRLFAGPGFCSAGFVALLFPSKGLHQISSVWAIVGC